MELQSPKLTELGIAAGILAIILFTVLGLLTGSAATIVAGAGAGLLLLGVSLVAAFAKSGG